MKPRIFRLALMILLSLPLGAAQGWRTFTDKSGRSFEGRVISIHENFKTATILTRKTNTKATMDLSVLSERDLTYLSTWKPGQVDEPEPAEIEPAESEEEEEASSRLYPRSKEEIRERLREIDKRVGPTGISRDQQETINRLNSYRYLSGVPDEVEADPEMVAQATDAAQACKRNGGLSHDLGHSTNLCNLANGSNMLSSVQQYINDAGANNREARGHRRWCLNPPMGKTGFGEDGAYSAMVAMDSSGRTRMKDSWAYPGKGFFPKEYLHGNAWSLYLTEKSPPREDITVEVYELRKRPEKPFSNSEEIPGKALPVEYISVYGNAINFEPQPQPITGRGIYWVRVKGGGLREGYVVELY
ncbi:hypothetical protein HZ994_00970 [Akkermansiaceae bacterium]|nr:hypothetical protein HZ994_00970 [Akkermansiaceae bacterium]